MADGTNMGVALYTSRNRARSGLGRSSKTKVRKLGKHCKEIAQVSSNSEKKELSNLLAESFR